LTQTWPTSTGRELERALLINLIQKDLTFLLISQEYSSLKVHLEGGWTVEMLIKYKNTIIKMNNQMVNSKTRSEARFPIKGSRVSPLNSSRLRVEVHNCLLPWIRQTNKYEWCKQYVASRVKCNESNNTSVSNIERVKWKKW